MSLATHFSKAFSSHFFFFGFHTTNHGRLEKGSAGGRLTRDDFRFALRPIFPSFHSSMHHIKWSSVSNCSKRYQTKIHGLHNQTKIESIYPNRTNRLRERKLKSPILTKRKSVRFTREFPSKVWKIPPRNERNGSRHSTEKSFSVEKFSSAFSPARVRATNFPSFDGNVHKYLYVSVRLSPIAHSAKQQLSPTEKPNEEGGLEAIVSPEAIKWAWDPVKSGVFCHDFHMRSSIFLVMKEEKAFVQWWRNMFLLSLLMC